MEEKIDSILYKLDLINKSLNSIPVKDDVYIKYLLPLLLLILSIGAKIVIDREANKDDAMKSLFKIPTDITFLCTSLLIAFAAYDFPNITRNLFYIIFFILLGMTNIFLSRRASKEYSNQSSKKWLSIIIGDALISFLVLVLTILFI